jgi:Putative adhesin
MNSDSEAGERARAQIMKDQRSQRGRVRVGWVLLMFALMLPGLAAQNQQRMARDGNGWMQESTGQLGSEKSLQVTHFVGAVQVVVGTQSSNYILRLHSEEPLEKDARKQFADFHLGVGRRPGEILIQAVGPTEMAVRAELILHLPVGTEDVHVDTLAGKITIQGAVNHLDLQTHGGDIELDYAQLLSAVTLGGAVTVNHRVGDSLIRTGGGDIRLNASVGDLEISSLGGNIWLKTIARGQVQSGGGNIEVVRCKGPLRVRTAGGNINLGEMDGEVTAETGGGNIRIGVAHGTVVATTALGNIELWKLSQGADAHTGMGRITAEFVGDRNSMRTSELVTSRGDIVVYFAGTVPGNLHAVTGSCPSRHILSEFPELKISNGVAEYGPRSVAAEGAIHGGGPVIEMRTMVGQIELRNAR